MNTMTLEINTNFIIDGVSYNNVTVISEVMFQESGIGNKIFNIECLSAGCDGKLVEDFDQQNADFYRNIEKLVADEFYSNHDYSTKPDDDFHESSYEDYRIK